LFVLNMNWPAEIETNTTKSHIGRGISSCLGVCIKIAASTSQAPPIFAKLAPTQHTSTEQEDGHIGRGVSSCAYAFGF
jgi:hypothetical protein